MRCFQLAADRLPAPPLRALPTPGRYHDLLACRSPPSARTSVIHRATHLPLPSTRFVLLLAVLSVSACARDTRRGDPDIQVRWAISPSPPSVGTARLRVIVSDARWRLRNGAHVTVSATRDSVRMAVDTAMGQGAGQYAIDDFLFPVAGDWVLSARVETPDGRWAEVDHPLKVGERAAEKD